MVSQAGGVLLVETARKSGLDQAISAVLAPWRKRRAVHDPGQILLDVAMAVALGRGGRGPMSRIRIFKGAELRAHSKDLYAAVERGR